MRLKVTIVASAILALSVFGSGIVSASDSHTGTPATPVTHHTGTIVAPSFTARCSAAHPGGTIKVRAKVRHAVRGTTATATASAAFAGGPAARDLKRRGESYAFVGKIAVPSTQPVGPVTVTVTITYGGAPTVLTCTSAIHPVRPHNG